MGDSVLFVHVDDSRVFWNSKKNVEIPRMKKKIQYTKENERERIRLSKKNPKIAQIT